MSTNSKINHKNDIFVSCGLRVSTANVHVLNPIRFIGHITCLNLGATTTDLPPGTLYRVKATYKYVKEDVDELSFEVGDTIRVIEYDDPEDQVNVFRILIEMTDSRFGQIYYGR